MGKAARVLLSRYQIKDIKAGLRSLRDIKQGALGTPVLCLRSFPASADSGSCVTIKPQSRSNARLVEGF